MERLRVGRALGQARVVVALEADPGGLGGEQGTQPLEQAVRIDGLRALLRARTASPLEHRRQPVGLAEDQGHQLGAVRGQGHARQQLRRPAQPRERIAELVEQHRELGGGLGQREGRLRPELEQHRETLPGERAGGDLEALAAARSAPLAQVRHPALVAGETRDRGERLAEHPRRDAPAPVRFGRRQASARRRDWPRAGPAPHRAAPSPVLACLQTAASPASPRAIAPC
ncbi:MAG: hypothetical protein RML12_11210 [Xanthomonadales bacterium]|nr:hypothetical protein [Xanthomonadales bacterium]